MDVKRLVRERIAEWDKKYRFVKSEFLVLLDADTKSVDVREQLLKALGKKGRGQFLCVRFDRPRPTNDMAEAEREEFEGLVEWTLKERGGWWVSPKNAGDKLFDPACLAVWFSSRNIPAKKS